MLRQISLQVELGSGSELLAKFPHHNLSMNPDGVYYVLFFPGTSDSPYVSREFTNICDANEALARRLATLTSAGFIMDIRKNVHPGKLVNTAG